MLKIIPNPDPEEFKRITQKVIDNDGYCPCLLEKNDDTKCHCQRFMKIEVPEEEEKKDD